MKGTDADSLTIREVTRETWHDFEKLFESKGGPKYCWCMAWRATPAEIKHADSADRKDQIAERVNSATPIGILGYLRSEPIAWCSIAPRSTFRGLVRNSGADEGIWSITCFFVLRRLRRSNIATAMLSAAVKHAKRKGAKIVEGYPVDADSPSYRHMGFVSMFEDMGFLHRGREGSRRHVMRLSLKK
jgi:GNAT superfamily N-acetyltransferase